MRALQIVFSPTGGTQAVVDGLLSGMPNDVETDRLDILDRGAVEPCQAVEGYDFAVVAVPSFAGLVPTTAVERISRLRGNETPALIVAVYGNRAYEDTLVQLQDVCEKAGFKTRAAVAAVAEHSIAHCFGTGRPDQDDRLQLASFGADFYRALSCGAEDTALEVPGNRPYKSAAAFPLVPRADDSCVECGICARRCPVGAIPADESRSADSCLCISCQACVVVCPRQSRSIDSERLSVLTERIRPFAESRKLNELFLPAGIAGLCGGE